MQNYFKFLFPVFMYRLLALSFIATLLCHVHGHEKSLKLGGFGGVKNCTFKWIKGMLVEKLHNQEETVMVIHSNDQFINKYTHMRKN